MMIGLVIKTGVLLGVLALLCSSLVRFIYFLDLNKRAYNHVPGQCTSVAGMESGAAGLALLSSGQILVTTGLRLYNSSELKDVRGQIYAYNASGKSAWELSIESKTLTKKNFNPHGLSVFEEGDRKLVFLVNHRPKADTVEIFKYKESEDDKRSVLHLKTIKSPLFINLRDVVAVGKDKFYATNFHYFKKDFMQTSELYFNLPTGSVVFFDGKNATYAAEWIPTPSGLALDKSKKYLYVSSLTGEKLLVYKIEEDASLTFHSEVPLNTSPDGIFVDPYTADLYVACHPVKSRLFRHESFPKNVLSPTQIVKLHGRPTKGKWTYSEAYVNDGATLSGGCDVVRLKGHIVIGSLHDKLLSCELDNPKLI